NLISKLGAWSIEHRDIPREKVPYMQVFPQHIEKIRRHYHQKDIKRIQDMGKIFLDTQNFEDLSQKSPASMSPAEALAHRAFLGMQSDYNYGPESAKEALIQLIRARYR
ncbi:hypothetical protein GW915_08645, partial [bacterium]|nr:hypothetical protein [bacterium]